MKKIIIFASGSGSNAEAIMKQSSEQGFVVTALICDKKNAPVLQKAAARGVPYFLIEKAKGEDRAAHETRILSAISPLSFDLIILAGYERLLSPTFLSALPPLSIVNIHPSLLPAYPGLNSYERAFNDKVQESGISIHYVDSGIDTGRIITQEKFKRMDSDFFSLLV
jgi:phosphoribosylglycinamide formyltransferase-1